MISIKFEEREKIGLQYALETLHGCSPFGQERIRRLRFYAPEERAALMAKLTEYYDALQAYNASALVPVELSESAQAFFDKIVILNGCMDDDRRFAETLFTA